MIKKVYLYLFTLLSFASTVQAQDVDSLFSEARKLGFNGEREKAINLCQLALKKSPNYSDIRIFLGRLYTWSNKYDSARLCFKETLTIDSKNIEAYIAWADAELWSDNYQEVLIVCDKGLQIDSVNAPLLLRKIKGLMKLERYEEAELLMRYALKKNPQDPTLFEYSEFMRRIIQKNKLSFGYDHDQFNKTFKPWNLYSIAYTRNTKWIGSTIVRYNIADRFGKQGGQLELDAYPSIGSKTYLYLNIGYSDISIFPNYKWSASAYRSLPKAFEAEIGIRYLRYTNDTWIYTASIGKYWKNFWFSIRPNFIPNAAGSGGSLNFSSRYYLGDANKYIGITLGSGISADELRINRNDVNTNNYLLKSNRVKLNYQQPLKKNFNIGVGAGYAEEETSFSGFRTNYNLSFFIEKIF